MSKNEHSYLKLKSTSLRNYYFDLSVRRYMIDKKSSFHPWQEEHVRELAVMIEEIISTHEFARMVPVDQQAETAT